ncbi:hypothetical protein [Desulfobaculum bizertense]|uniref:Uncharacterized protein n=1 Tax=Desulfobaculum bizertense DSM 18034 TaxID=1121442 RepID=A0A1T4W171_9BACT|nr:hypothetical protein [Desulfobaculum bizertense]UIJ38926.1 hypothetical protein LWC08_04960 [Desulfobaculum bizertense]SKA71006.1 hypothetical protein SAMN02745702_01390 [Desulfobaculum bizertense DSM 18034]
MDSKNAVLQTRLLNCLETIVELEQDLERLQLGHVLLDEFSQLKAFMKRIDQVHVEEEDVRRIERATSNFLEELRAPLQLASTSQDRPKLVQ